MCPRTHAFLVLGAATLLAPWAPPARAGVAMDDFTGDDLLDVLTSPDGAAGGLRFYRNEGNGTFTDLTEPSGLQGAAGGDYLVPLDVSGDGALDLLVLRPGGEPALTLLVQAGGGFRDATQAAGLAGAGDLRIVCAADVDADGRLDLFLGGNEPGGKLLRNRGDGTFEDVSETAGVAGKGACSGAAFGDFDWDGRPDLYVTRRDAANELWRNNGDGTFTETAAAAGVAGPVDSGQAWFADYDGDRNPDILVAGSPETGRRLWTYRNVPGSGFREATEEDGLADLRGVRNVKLVDADSDGLQDLLVTTSGANVLVRNDRNRGFVAADPGWLPADPTPSLALGDLDEDGDVDALVGDARYSAAAGFGDALLVHPGAPDVWTCVVLRGAESDSFGVGCLVRVLTETRRGHRRDFFRSVRVGSPDGGDSLRQEFALGGASRILGVSVHWPGTGRWQRFFQPRANGTLIVDESDTDLVILRTRMFRLREDS